LTRLLRWPVNDRTVGNRQGTAEEGETAGEWRRVSSGCHWFDKETRFKTCANELAGWASKSTSDQVLSGSLAGPARAPRVAAKTDCLA
jgi:hypothetical protein